ncbi:hypothetical protein NBRC116594_40510 [Shimia sp. NS0008-38b]|uniref:hypothetical protein n=1 Tax=Shimia sp. NS0008-38b TaxID=3127653 RepID=UPI003102A591
MIASHDIDDKVTQLLELAREKFGVRAKTLDKAMRKLGRRVPSRLHRQAEVISAAQKLGGNPKLMVQVDGDAVGCAFAEIKAHLSSVDVRERRIDRLLDVLGSISFNLIALTALLIVFLRWQGVL